MNYKYFNLNPECYLIVGERRAVIQNLLTSEVVWLDEDDTNLLIDTEKGNAVDDSKEILKELEEKKWGFFSDKKFYIDKIRTMNLFNEKKFWKERPIVYSAVMQLTDACNMRCSKCEEIFCPNCIHIHNEEKDLPVEKWINVIKELKKFGLMHLVLTGGEVTLYDGLYEIIDFALNKGVKVTISTNGINKLNAINDKLDIIININEPDQIEKVIENYKDVDGIKVVNYTSEYINIEEINKSWKIVKDSIEAPFISENSILNTDLQQFFANKYSNSCLKFRMYITNNLNVVPCFGDKKNVIGNIIEKGISQLIYDLSTNYWNKPKSKFQNSSKCVNCEFKYSCSICTNVKSNTNCKYRLEIGEWV